MKTAREIASQIGRALDDGQDNIEEMVESALIEYGNQKIEEAAQKFEDDSMDIKVKVYGSIKVAIEIRALKEKVL